MSQIEEKQQNFDIRKVRRASINDLENKLKKMPQVDMPPVHHFSNGVYARELFIPRGTLLIGKIHKYESLNILSQGTILIMTEEGEKMVSAPFHVVSPPGTKRVGFALTDVTWTTIHATEEKDLEKIEDEVIAKDYDEVEVLDVVEKERLEQFYQKGVELCHG